MGREEAEGRGRDEGDDDGEDGGNILTSTDGAEAKPNNTRMEHLGDNAAVDTGHSTLVITPPWIQNGPHLCSSPPKYSI